MSLTMKAGIRRGAIFTIAALALLGVFSMYVQPELIISLANQIWACF
ncbi:hypothetical protein BH09PSE5_BH09PSE5_06080 [soil metagenome]